MKHSFIAPLLLCMAAGSAQAENYAYLAIEKTDGTVQTLDVAQLKITYGNGNLLVSNAKEQQSIALNQLCKMYFTNEAKTSSALNKVVSDGSNGTLKIYSLTGVYMGQYTNIETARKALPQGIYVVDDEQRTFKLEVK